MIALSNPAGCNMLAFELCFTCAEKMICHFVSDLHGAVDRYRKLFEAIRKDKRKAYSVVVTVAVRSASVLVIAQSASGLHQRLSGAGMYGDAARDGERLPRIFMILGNDDLGRRKRLCLTVRLQLLGIHT